MESGSRRLSLGMKKSMLFALTLAAPLFAASFKAPCKLPFAAISTKQPIDSKCGLSGSPKNSTALAAQDTAKDNFCATGATAALTFDVYPGLQTAAETALGTQNYEPPEPDRPSQSLYVERHENRRRHVGDH